MRRNFRNRVHMKKYQQEEKQQQALKAKTVYFDQSNSKQEEYIM